MANLLPTEIKNDLRADLLNRKLVVVGNMLIVLLLFIIVIFGAFWFSLFIRNSDSTNFAVATNKEVKEVKGLSPSVSLLKKIESQTKVLNNYWQEPLISNIITKTLVAKSTDLKITGLVIERGEIGKATKLSIVGLSKNRMALVNYVDLLRRDKFFSRVDLPVESLLNEQGGQFVVNLEK